MSATYEPDPLERDEQAGADVELRFEPLRKRMRERNSRHQLAAAVTDEFKPDRLALDYRGHAH